MKDLIDQIKAGACLVVILIVWVIYCLWCMITGQPVQPIN